MQKPGAEAVLSPDVANEFEKGFTASGGVSSCFFERTEKEVVNGSEMKKVIVFVLLLLSAAVPIY